MVILSQCLCRQEYTKRPPSGAVRKYHPHHISQPSNATLQECLARSDVVISAVPSAEYKVKTVELKDGCVCINVSSEKNFEKDVREKASMYLPSVGKITILMLLRNLWVEFGCPSSLLLIMAIAVSACKGTGRNVEEAYIVYCCCVRFRVNQDWSFGDGAQLIRFGVLDPSAVGVAIPGVWIAESGKKRTRCR
jgi:hypothetical protein